MKLRFIFFVYFLISCGSLDESRSRNDDFNENVEASKDIADIPKKRLPPTSMKYSSQFDSIQLKNISGFQKETLDGTSLGVNLQTNDEILQITSKCRSGSFATGQGIAAKLHNKYKAWPTYWNAVGLCYHLQKNYYNAKLFFNKANSIKVKYAPSINNLGLVAIAEQKWYEGLNYFKEAKRINPNSQVANYNLGRLYLAFGLGEKAIPYFEAIRDKNFYNSKVLRKVAIAYSMSGKHSKALSMFNKINNPDETTRLFKAYSLATLKKKTEANQILQATPIGNSNPNYSLYLDIKRML